MSCLSAYHSLDERALLCKYSKPFHVWTPGDGWGEIAVPLIQAYPGSAVVFMGSSLTLVFGVLNLIVAVEFWLHLWKFLFLRCGMFCDMWCFDSRAVRSHRLKCQLLWVFSPHNDPQSRFWDSSSPQGRWDRLTMSLDFRQCLGIYGSNGFVRTAHHPPEILVAGSRYICWCSPERHAKFGRRDGRCDFSALNDVSLPFCRVGRIDKWFRFNISLANKMLFNAALFVRVCH